MKTLPRTWDNCKHIFPDLGTACPHEIKNSSASSARLRRTIFSHFRGRNCARVLNKKRRDDEFSTQKELKKVVIRRFWSDYARDGRKFSFQGRSAVQYPADFCTLDSLSSSETLYETGEIVLIRMSDIGLIDQGTMHPGHAGIFSGVSRP